MSNQCDRADQRLRARELQTLLEEIRHYLDAVEVFRGEGHEPHWTSATVPNQART